MSKHQLIFLLSYLWTRCSDFYSDSLYPVRTRTARPPGPAPRSPIKCPGSGRRSWRRGAAAEDRAAAGTPAADRALRCCCPGSAAAPAGRGAPRAASARARRRCGTRSGRRQKPPSPSGLRWACPLETSQQDQYRYWFQWKQLVCCGEKWS